MRPTQVTEYDYHNIQGNAAEVYLLFLFAVHLVAILITNHNIQTPLFSYIA